MVCKIDKRDKMMLEMRKRGLTLEEIGDSFNITRERVRQLLALLRNAGFDTPHRLIRPDSKVNVKCSKCGKEFKRSKWHAQRVRTTLCSKKCLRTPGSPYSGFGAIKVICTNCDKEFERIPKYHSMIVYNRLKKSNMSQRHYCSRKCFMDYTRKKPDVDS
jgi:Zn finger protein HypA/HybF involved in hydrogenase expression